MAQNYDSDGSTLVNEAHRPQQSRRRSGGSRRYRSPSSSPERDRRRHSYSYDGAPPYPNTNAYTYTKTSDSSKYATVGKVALVVGIVGVLLHKWQKEKEAQRRRQERHEREERRRRRKDFDKAKKARRREEERREREEEADEFGSPQAEVRRIEYRPLEQVRSRSSSASSGERRRPGRGEREFDGRRSRSRYAD